MKKSLSPQGRFNLKKRIKFTTLRSEGAKCLELSGDEVVQLAGKDEDLCIVRQEYLLELLNARSNFKMDDLFSAVSAQVNSQLDMKLNNFESKVMGCVQNSLQGLKKEDKDE